MDSGRREHPGLTDLMQHISESGGIVTTRCCKLSSGFGPVLNGSGISRRNLRLTMPRCCPYWIMTCSLIEGLFGQIIRRPHLTPGQATLVQLVSDKLQLGGP